MSSNWNWSITWTDIVFQLKHMLVHDMMDVWLIKFMAWVRGIITHSIHQSKDLDTTQFFNSWERTRRSMHYGAPYYSFIYITQSQDPHLEKYKSPDQWLNLSRIIIWLWSAVMSYWWEWKDSYWILMCLMGTVDHLLDGQLDLLKDYRLEIQLSNGHYVFAYLCNLFMLLGLLILTLWKNTGMCNSFVALKGGFFWIVFMQLVDTLFFYFPELNEWRSTRYYLDWYLGISILWSVVLVLLLGLPDMVLSTLFKDLLERMNFYVQIQSIAPTFWLLFSLFYQIFYIAGKILHRMFVSLFFLKQDFDHRLFLFLLGLMWAVQFIFLTLYKQVYLRLGKSAEYSVRFNYLNFILIYYLMVMPFIENVFSTFLANRSWVILVYKSWYLGFTMWNFISYLDKTNRELLWDEIKNRNVKRAREIIISSVIPHKVNQFSWQRICSSLLLCKRSDVMMRGIISLLISIYYKSYVLSLAIMIEMLLSYNTLGWIYSNLLEPVSHF